MEEALRGLPAAAAAIDLELHLSLPSAPPRPPAAAAGAPRPSTRPRSSGAEALVLGLDLSLVLGLDLADDWGLHRVKSEGPPPLLDVVDLRMPSTPRNQDSAPGSRSKRVKTEQPTTTADDADDDAALLLLALQYPRSKRVKTEQPTTTSSAEDDAALLLALRFPRAASRARRSRRRRADPYTPVAAAAYNHRVLDDSCDAVPAWVRAEVLPRHDLPGDLLLHYVGEKVLRHSDLNSGQARFLIPSTAAVRLRAFLSADEIAACGFDSADRNSKKEENGTRAQATSYDGVAVSVYVSGGAVCGVSELKLNTFHCSKGTVINGTGYKSFICSCGLAEGDGVEFWAFRRPAHRLCFLIAKRDDVFCPLDHKSTRGGVDSLLVSSVRLPTVVS